MKTFPASSAVNKGALLVLLLAAYPLATPLLAEPGLSSESISSRYITLSIQGDLRNAADLFGRNDLLSEADLELKRKFETRFRQQPDQKPGPPGDANLADDLAAVYRSYWRHGLLGDLQHHEIEDQFSEQLDRVRDDHSDASIPLRHDQEGFPGAALDDKEIYYLDTFTPPYKDLFIWREQKSARYRVQLTDASTPVTVNFMDDFVVQGWKEYASLGLATTTGWVENGELYCVSWAYDTATENFAVSYLKHEARHLVDLQKYPDMQPVELEYRAKLTELSYAHSSLKRILDDFRSKAVENPDSAHAMANWQVTRDIYRKLEGSEIPDNWAGWGYPDTGRVNRVARALLEENSKQNEL